MGLTLVPLLVASITRYRRKIPNAAYTGGFALGVFTCLVWALSVYYLAMKWKSGVGFYSYMALFPAVLAAEAGLAGFVGLSSRWKAYPLLLAILGAFVALRIAIRYLTRW